MEMSRWSSSMVVPGKEFAVVFYARRMAGGNVNTRRLSMTIWDYMGA
jgi:hypothetical protein